MNQSEETHTHTHTLTHTHIQPSQVRDPRAFIQTVYTSSVFMVDDLAIGPFLSSACSQGGVPHSPDPTTAVVNCGAFWHSQCGGVHLPGLRVPKFWGIFGMLA